MDIERTIYDIEDAANISERRGGITLSAWEEEFFESIKEQWEERGFLTEKQKTKLAQIWERI